MKEGGGGRFNWILHKSCVYEVSIYVGLGLRSFNNNKYFFPCRYADLKNNRLTNYTFNFDQMLNDKVPFCLNIEFMPILIELLRDLFAINLWNLRKLYTSVVYLCNVTVSKLDSGTIFLRALTI